MCHNFVHLLISSLLPFYNLRLSSFLFFSISSTLFNTTSQLFASLHDIVWLISCHLWTFKLPQKAHGPFWTRFHAVFCTVQFRSRPNSVMRSLFFANDLMTKIENFQKVKFFTQSFFFQNYWVFCWSCFWTSLWFNSDQFSRHFEVFSSVQSSIFCPLMRNRVLIPEKPYFFTFISEKQCSKEASMKRFYFMFGFISSLLASQSYPWLDSIVLFNCLWLIWLSFLSVHAFWFQKKWIFYLQLSDLKIGSILSFIISRGVIAQFYHFYLKLNL